MIHAVEPQQFAAAGVPAQALEGAEGEAAAILREVTALNWRFRTRDGSWIDAWAADDAARLPLAVELTVARRGGAPLTLRFLVGPDGLSPDGLAGEAT